MRSTLDTVAAVLIAFAIGITFVVAFQEWYDYTEARRAMKRARRDHPSSSGPRYE